MSEPPIYVDVCIWQDGIHVFAAKDCNHDCAEDEEGTIYLPGWTVQNAPVLCETRERRRGVSQ